MTYDFTSIIDRRGMDAIAVDLPEGYLRGAETREGFDRIPMWVADMNFAACPAITRAIIRRAEHPLFGYFEPKKEYFDAIIRWQTERNGVQGLMPEHIGYENGVLGGVGTALRVLCSRGDTVLVHSPTYIGFTHLLENNGYRIVHSPLVQDENGTYRMDLADMEQKIKAHHIHAAIFCSPHNPTGRVWSRAEIEGAMALYEKYGITVISDEIWSDIILPGHTHVPTHSVSNYARSHTVSLYAPSKTFNLAGLVGSYHLVFDRVLKERMDKESSLCHYNSMNIFSQYAILGGYSEEGALWVEELRQVIDQNIRFALEFIRTRIPGVRVSAPQGTYMLFLDCTDWCAAHGLTIEELLKKGFEYGVIWQDGTAFHGPCHIRMNLALPFTRVQEAFRRLEEYVF